MESESETWNDLFAIRIIIRIRISIRIHNRNRISSPDFHRLLYVQSYNIGHKVNAIRVSLCCYYHYS